ncbi:hypothetical protein ACHAPC_004966 [Botrytis cinerea]|uniref:Uncharacterized protein n=1 Tax=Botryotinia fuckeliana (strain BcDW1) TaxID=1290391 RepID=M7TDS3_BOTF1|nr:hypothetical protein BcDW1_9732 [Botrytis cinerea BcDW1]
MAEGDHGSLEPPTRTSIEDSGAHELAETVESSDSEDHFSDAHSGLEPSTVASPTVPTTRIEKVDDEPSYGEVPGTQAYSMRAEDAEPDQVAMAPEFDNIVRARRPSTPGDLPIPITVVEKIDPDTPSHGEVPGTPAYEKRKADAVPDLVLDSTPGRSRSNTLNTTGITRSRAGSTPGDLPIPKTVVERIDSGPSHGEVPGTAAYELRKEDAQPDDIVEVADVPESSSRSLSPRRQSSSAATNKAVEEEYNEEEDGDDGQGGDDGDGADDADDGGFGDDFDDFEEGEEDAEFGDFDDGFQEPEVTQSSLPIPVVPSFPTFDLTDLDAPEDIRSATEPYLDHIFPSDTIDISVLPPLDNPNPIFLTPRSASLWSQLVAPPPLQPPNWIRSRIRRLFLVSLGIPVSLDEILPASTQKKLILPSLSLHPSSSGSLDSSIDRIKSSSSTSLDSQGNVKPTRSDSRRRKGPPPAPQLDLVSARQTCEITEEALQGLTIDELKGHVKKLEEMEILAKEVLDYWTMRTDEKLGDREAFEGVIENLVKHARKVRK